MDHEEATTSLASERYLLGEMSDGERDAFEAHYFECPECASGVADGAEMMAAGRDVAGERATVHRLEPRRTWKAWVPQAAAASIVCLGLGWYAGMRTLSPPPPPAAPASVQLLDRQVDLETGQERGPDGAAPIEVRENQITAINFFVPATENAVSYQVTVRNDAGRIFFSTPLSRARAEDPVTLMLRELPRGRYEVVIESVTSEGRHSTVARNPFDVRGPRSERRQP